MQDGSRMGIEGDHTGQTSFLLRLGHQLPNEVLVTHVDAVKGSHTQDRLLVSYLGREGQVLDFTRQYMHGWFLMAGSQADDAGAGC
jgi:hypothetical protein